MSFAVVLRSEIFTWRRYSLRAPRSRKFSSRLLTYTAFPYIAAECAVASAPAEGVLTYFSGEHMRWPQVRSGWNLSPMRQEAVMAVMSLRISERCFHCIASRVFMSGHCEQHSSGGMSSEHGVPQVETGRVQPPSALRSLLRGGTEPLT